MGGIVIHSISFTFSLNVQIETMVSSFGKPLLVIDGYKLRYHHTDIKGNQRWTCSLKSCKATAQTNSSGELTGGTLQHNHQAPGDNALSWEKLKNSVKDRIMMGENPEDVLRNLPHEISRDEVQRLRRYAYEWAAKSKRTSI